MNGMTLDDVRPPVGRRYGGFLDRLSQSTAVVTIAMGIVGIAALAAERSGVQWRGKIFFDGNPNVGILFVMCGAVLMLLQSRQARSNGRRWARTVSGLVVLAALLTLCEYLFNVNLGLDRWWRGPSAAGSSLFYRGRIPPAAASNFLLIGLGLLLLDVRSDRNHRPHQFFALVVALTSTLSLFASVPDDRTSESVTSYAHMPWMCALGFAILAVGLLSTRSEGIHSAGESGGRVSALATRNAALAIVVVPLIIALATRLTGAHLGLHSSEFGLAFFAALNILTIASLVWAYGRSIETTDKLRETARRALGESEERWQSVMRAVLDAIIVTDGEDRILSWNPAAEQMFGLSGAEATGAPMTRVLDQASHGAYHETVRRLKAGSDGRRFERTLDLVGARKDASTFPIEVSIGTWEAGGKPYCVSVARDVTKRRELEEAFHQALKMEAVGRLAGGIAHDFNNMLTVILGYSQTGLSRAAPNNPIRPCLEQIKQAGQRASQLTRQLLAFSRKQVLNPQVLDLSGVVRDMDGMVRRIVREDVAIETSLAKDLGHVKADLGQVNQVIMNLVVNARDAMPNGGTLRIETDNVEVSESYAATHPGTHPGRYVRLTVADTGCGMSKETLQHIFEPFYTTKAAGHGTGLGLATVYGITTQSEGHIAVRSELGAGTTFDIFLPRIDEPTPPPDSHPGDSASSRGSETVLVVEDNASVRDLICTVLAELGYNVLRASGGTEAVEISSHHRGLVNLLLTDVVMPGMGGREVAERCRTLHPEMSILFMSGYSDAAAGNHGVSITHDHFIQKPFMPDALALKIREALDSRPQEVKV